MMGSGLKARIVCVDPSKLEAAYAGKDLGDVWQEFPAKVDPCGENGEFHSFVYDGPMFNKSIPIQNGEIVTRDGFVYADVLI
jgi:diphthamide synthase (EF-2-diphthine--ammonia ligase)